LERQATRLGLGDSVIFAGPVRDVPDRMRAADALVLPSLYEGFPNVLVEAQLSGLPALVSDRVTRDCDMTGLVTYLPLDEAVWAEAMAKAAPIDRAAASRSARGAIAERGFDIHVAAAALRRRYEELLTR
jgi:glycosyltransferase involved in cell wall biosynthesis